MGLKRVALRRWAFGIVRCQLTYFSNRVINVSKQGRGQAARGECHAGSGSGEDSSHRDAGRLAQEQEAIARGIFADRDRAEVAWVLDREREA